MVRENNKKERAQEEEAPEFGAGSEYGKAQREEARRKKYGFVSKKYNPDAQPWLMRVGNKKEGKHYRGVREGGVSANTCYYVFTHAQDGSFEAHPIKVSNIFESISTRITSNLCYAPPTQDSYQKYCNYFNVGMVQFYAQSKL